MFEFKLLYAYKKNQTTTTKENLVAAKIIPGIITPTRKMTREQIAEQIHLRRRAGRIEAKDRDSTRGGRSAGRQKAISSGW